jgi:hypothetical protein
VRVQVSHPYKTTGKFMVLNILTLKFWRRDWKTKAFEQNCSKHSPNLIYSLFLCECNFDLLLLFPSTWILSYFQRIYYRLQIVILSYILVMIYNHALGLFYIYV